MTPQQLQFRHSAEIALRGSKVNEEVKFICPYCKGLAFAYKGDDCHHGFCLSCRQKFGGYYQFGKSSTVDNNTFLSLPDSRVERLKVLFEYVGVDAGMAKRMAECSPVEPEKKMKVRQPDPWNLVSEEEHPLVEQLHLAGCSQFTISKKLGISAKAMNRWYESTGYIPNNHVGCKTVENDSEAWKYYKMGYTTCDIAYAIGKSEDGVRKWLHKNGLEANKKRPVQL